MRALIAAAAALLAAVCAGAQTWSGPLDPRLPKGTTWNSRGIIDACRPFEMLKDYPPVVKASRELRDKVAAKFARELKRP